MGVDIVILIVEDNDALRRSVARQLRRLGYKTHEVADAVAARLLLKEQKFDLLFTDVVLPGQENGIMLAKNILALYPGMAVLLTSGYVPDIEDCDDSDLKLVTLYKPYGLDELGKAVQQALHP